MDSYLVISADGHAGPPASVYRDYLDPEFRERVRRAPGMMAELREAMAAMDDSDVPRGVGGGDRRRRAHRRLRLRRPRRRSSTSEGVAAEVLFPDADVLGTGRHRLLAVRLRPRRRATATPSRPSPAAGPTTAGSPTSSPRTPTAASASPSSRIIPDMDGALAEIHEANDLGPAGILIPTRWFDRPRVPRPDLRAGLGGSPRTSAWCCTPTRAPGRPTSASARACCRSTPPRRGWWAARRSGC